ncbi:MAG: phosphatase PAP2 family protein [Limosilactobacillus sp.]|uniref:phosphatase PAP2 family protein n=1 Tax=Limosilactobacillus sp. TaxID=2773925 RepID=UPI0026F9C656|nr:phosphatase PAP2 family protein [Limosilactobacillus sp.]
MIIERDRHRLRRFIVSGVLFIALAFCIKFNASTVTLMDAVLQSLFTSQRMENIGAFHALMTLISHLASPKLDLVWAFLIAVFLWLKRQQIPALWVMCTILGGDVIGTVIKHVIQRVRPAQHLAADDGYSFPSGHTLGIFLVAAFILLFLVPMFKKQSTRTICQLVIVFFIFFLAISRVYLYAHWPFDTVGAMLLAYAWLQVAQWLYIKLAPALKNIRFLSSSEI